VYSAQRTGVQQTTYQCTANNVPVYSTQRTGVQHTTYRCTAHKISLYCKSQIVTLFLSCTFPVSPQGILLIWLRTRINSNIIEMILCSNATYIHSLSLSQKSTDSQTHSHTHSHKNTHSHTHSHKNTHSHTHSHKTKYFLCYEYFKCNNNEIKDTAWFLLVVIHLPSSTAPLLISMHDENNLQYNINRNPEICLQTNHAKSFISSYQHVLQFTFMMCMAVQLGSPRTVVSAFNDRRNSFVV
jgi:hypothetical protein